jgi:hypothetical protein
MISFKELQQKLKEEAPANSVGLPSGIAPPAADNATATNSPKLKSRKDTDFKAMFTRRAGQKLKEETELEEGKKVELPIHKSDDSAGEVAFNRLQDGLRGTKKFRHKPKKADPATAGNQIANALRKAVEDNADKPHTVHNQAGHEVARAKNVEQARQVVKLLDSRVKKEGEHWIKPVVKEEVIQKSEELSELSNKTLYNYALKAHSQLASAQMGGKEVPQKREDGVWKVAAKMDANTKKAKAESENRKGAFLKGGKPLTLTFNKEEVEQIDELKKSTLANYSNKASADYDKRVDAMHDMRGIPRATYRKAYMRSQGIKQAAAKMADPHYGNAKSTPEKKVEKKEAPKKVEKNSKVVAIDSKKKVAKPKKEAPVKTAKPTEDTKAHMSKYAGLE